MRLLVSLFALLVTAACSTTTSPEPSLAPRAAEAIDPRVPIYSAAPAGPIDPALGARLQELVNEARTGAPLFETLEADANRLAADAGPMASESWVVAQQALSRLIEQYGVTTRTAAEIDALAANRLVGLRWITPAEQAAIAAAASDVGAISTAQAEAIDRLKEQLAR